MHMRMYDITSIDTTWLLAHRGHLRLGGVPLGGPEDGHAEKNLAAHVTV